MRSGKPGERTTGGDGGVWSDLAPGCAGAGRTGSPRGGSPGGGPSAGCNAGLGGSSGGICAVAPCGRKTTAVRTRTKTPNWRARRSLNTDAPAASSRPNWDRPPDCHSPFTELQRVQLNSYTFLTITNSLTTCRSLVRPRCYGRSAQHWDPFGHQIRTPAPVRSAGRPSHEGKPEMKLHL